ncbi:MAG TPA: PQQ-binding-like beta-propeller repeat protein [Candidatus Hydrogenedentes bacterium]|nr:PQQ-binding-like beta-propeller repeat protein [Candidatus Hydrogenedentota bacterium]HPG66427.1 PQQ-binding-like beta-propeller repeat protein [Candidatus Hydrogenedentota bacterium]
MYRLGPWFLTLVSALSASATTEAVANWPQFRGPGALGVAEAEGLPDRWSSTENIAWKTNIPGRGWSSPVVWGDRVFLTTAVSLGETEELKKGLYFGGNRQDAPESVYQRKVFCLDLDSGRVRWEQQVHEGPPATPIHAKNSYASETPATDGERIYALFGNLGLYCLDMDGAVLWVKEFAPNKMRFGWGTASSPVVRDGRVYLVNDNDEDSYLLALDAKTGDEVWRVSRDEKSNWSTPYLWENERRVEIVTAGTDLVCSYGLDGAPLWWLKGMSAITIATPYASDGLLYVSSGYVGDKRRPLYAIRPGAAGDISLASGETSNEWIAWSVPQAAPYNPSTLVYDGRLYVLYDAGFLACFGAQDGTVRYDRQRIPDGRAFTASPWAYDGKVFCLDEDGVTFVFRAGDAFELMHTNPLAKDDMGMASPAIVGDRLLIRTSARLYCVRAMAAPGPAE